MAEQAIGAIYALAKHPDVVCTEIIRRKTKAVFQYDQPVQLPPDPAEDQVMQEAGLSEGGEHDALPDAPPPEAPPSETPPNVSFFPLSQLLFVVGHVASKFFDCLCTAEPDINIAVKQIVHLELLELEFKRRKTEQEKGNCLLHSYCLGSSISSNIT